MLDTRRGGHAPPRGGSPLGLKVFLGDLAAVDGDPAKQAGVRQRESIDRIADAAGVDRAVGANFDQRHGRIGTGGPAVAVAELVQRFLRHEQVDQRLRLRTRLEAERPRRSAVVARGRTVDAQRALAVFAADTEAGLNDAREDQHTARLGDQLARAGHT